MLAQLEKICQENPYTREYAVAKLLGVPSALKNFQRIVADFQSRLITQGYFRLEGSEKPTITREQIEKIQQNHHTLNQYELVEDGEEFLLVDPEANQMTYRIDYYPHFTEKSQFWGWSIQFKHYKSPRLDLSFEVS